MSGDDSTAAAAAPSAAAPPPPARAEAPAEAPAEAVAAAVARLRRGAHDGVLREEAPRRAALQQLLALLTEHEEALLDALVADLAPREETRQTDVQFAARDTRYYLKHLRRLCCKRSVSTPMSVSPGSGYVEAEPLGVVLIIAPWNFPVQLTLAPLAAAIAAGNTVLVKPSELAAHTSRLLGELIPRYFAPSTVALLEGGPETSKAILRERFDHILFTGSARIGRIVMRAAAEHLTPVTLELGGKNPCIVEEQVNLKVAARRVVWGRFLRAGQACVAPDYVFCHDAHFDEFVALLRQTIAEFFGEDPRESADYARIISRGGVARLRDMLAESGGTVACGGTHDEAARYFAPTVVLEPRRDSRLLEEEIFGPILPVMRYTSLGDVLRFIQLRPKPLVAYMFTTNHKVWDVFRESTSSGAAVLNDTCVHTICCNLPFGGVGESGTGAYHGDRGFETFSHMKSVLERKNFMDLDVRYPPMTPAKLKWLKRLV